MAVAVATACASSSRSSHRAASAGQTTAVTRVRVFDGHQARADQTVVFSAAGIAAVGDAASVEVPAGATVVDGRGKTLLPGFIDAHAHVSDANQLEQSSVFGVTTVLDMGCGDPKWGHAARAEANTPGSTLADLRFAGYAVTAPNGHCTEYGLPVPTVTTASDAATFVASRLGEGSDYLKLIYDDGSAYGLSFPTLDKATLRAAIVAAHEHHALALVHIGSLQGATDALEAGADGLAHTFLDVEPTAALGALAAAHHAFVVPTLTVDRSVVSLATSESLLADPAVTPYLTDAAKANLGKTFPPLQGAVTYPVAEASVRVFAKAHVPVLAGTDAPNPGTTYGASLHSELEWLVRAGLSPSEALVAATSAPAAAFRLTDRGEVREGLRADLVLVDQDPTVDIGATRHLASVWRGGHPVDRTAFAQRVAAQRAEAQQAPSNLGLVSDFADGTTATHFGSGWSVTTDQLAQGTSTATMTVTNGALVVRGVVTSVARYRWAGVMFSPGSRPMVPTNLSAKKQLVFDAKGDGQTYQVMLFTEAGGGVPSTQTFTAGPAWREQRMAFNQFDGADGHDVLGIAFVGGPNPGAVSFELDNVRLE